MAQPLTLPPDIADAVRQVLDAAQQPLPAAKLRSKLKIKPKLKDAFQAVLDAGHFFVWTGKTIRYSTIEPQAFARQTILAESVKPVALSKLLTKASKNYPKKDAELLVEELTRSGALIRIPLFGTGPKTKYSSVIDHPGLLRAELDAAKAVLDALYRRLGNPGPDSAIMAALADLEPQKGLLVTAARLRRALPLITKPDLDSALVRLQQERKVILHRHSNPNSLSAPERETLIQDNETFYVGACWRLTPENA